MKLYDTLSGKKKKLEAPKNKTLRLFVCGPTVYDYSHIGHARTYIAFDMFVKYLRHAGFKVNYVQNITDIDDKIIEKAHTEGVAAKKLAMKFEKYYMQDMKALGIDSINKYARASDYIKEIIKQINLLVKNGYAYKTSTGVYFRVKKFKNYGKLSHQKLDQLHGAVNIEEDDEKEDFHDFALWKTSRPEELHPARRGGASWDSPWGQGRPGWHIEDTAITYAIFKSPQYEIHGGARDLIFPHHEAEIAQIEAAYNKPPLVKFWMHTGYLQISGKKMSKSLKNFITIQNILKKYSPQILRLFFTTKHYRSPIDYTELGLEEAKANEKKLREFWMSLENGKWQMANGPSAKLGVNKSDKKISKYIKSFWDNLEDDFNTPKAFGTLFSLITYVNRKKSLHKKDKKIIIEFLESVNKIFNIVEKEKIILSDKMPKNIIELVKKREILRIEKKWEDADEIRKKIENMGYIIEDLDDKSMVKKK